MSRFRAFWQASDSALNFRTSRRTRWSGPAAPSFKLLRCRATSTVEIGSIMSHSGAPSAGGGGASVRGRRRLEQRFPKGNLFLHRKSGSDFTPLACEYNLSAASPGGFVESLDTRVCCSTLRSRGLSYLALLTCLHTPNISLGWRKQLQEILIYEVL